MTFSKNNVLHNNHFHKDWQRRVRTWFNQAGRKHRRRQDRQTKAARLGIRPLQLLRPAIRPSTIRYNMKIREGRGFTHAELKEAGVNYREARGIGICVDRRRRNLSEEGKNLNVARLKDYKARLIVFPKNAKKPKKNESTGDDLKAETTRAPLPLPPAVEHEAPRKITDEERAFKAARTLRIEHSKAKYAGKLAIRRQKKEEEEANKRK
ncbi:60S ribosomal protein L13 [Cantharellus anzutake]|uniref:60S ribosomal protein L13 n=1 Tax=Cantharellus anzutake TaxID=1750568 RepID=UPI001908547A|nr:60S ribosomal protein L13 [Cantharellus anzutake]KAF8327912.1 60S ribosomal protein L13 [Cantharellus anzutake]